MSCKISKFVRDHINLLNIAHVTTIKISFENRSIARCSNANRAMRKYSSRVAASLFPIGRRKDYLGIDGSPVSGRIRRLQIVAVASGGRSGVCGSVTRAGRAGEAAIRWCLQPRRSAVKRTRDKGRPRHRSSNAARVVWPWGGRRG